MWRRLRAVLPERQGLLILDSTTFSKQGQHSVGVGRQYCGLQRQITNCQKAVTAALWTGARAYLLGAALYLPEEWLTDAARAHARASPRRSPSNNAGAWRLRCCVKCARAASP